MDHSPEFLISMVNQIDFAWCVSCMIYGCLQLLYVVSHQATGHIIVQMYLCPRIIYHVALYTTRPFVLSLLGLVIIIYLSSVVDGYQGGT